MNKVNKPHSYKQEISIIIPLNEQDEDINLIKSFMDFTILNQTHGNKKIILMFVTYSKDEAFIKQLIDFKNTYGFKDVLIYGTDDKTIQKLEELKQQIKTEWYCYKTISAVMINNKLLPSQIQYLPTHLEEAIRALTTDRKLNPQFFIPKVEYVDVTTYGVKDDPDLLETRTFETLNVQYITIDEWIFNRHLKFSWQECLTEQNGMPMFLPGLLLKRFYSEMKPGTNERVNNGAIIENCTVRQYINPQQIRKNLRIYVDGNVWGARA